MTEGEKILLVMLVLLIAGILFFSLSGAGGQATGAVTQPVIPSGIIGRGCGT